MIVAGCFRIVLAIRHWHLPGAGLLLLGGLVSIGVGIALYITLPWSGLWVLGTLIAIELIIHRVAGVRTRAAPVQMIEAVATREHGVTSEARRIFEIRNCFWSPPDRLWTESCKCTR